MIRSRFAALLGLAILLPSLAAADPPTSHNLSPLETSAIVEPGDTLQAILARAGIDPADQAETALALTGVYDVADLRPGDRVVLKSRGDDRSRLSSLALTVTDGVEIALSYSGRVSVERREPQVTTSDRQEILTLDSTLYDALVEHTAPERFAVDLVALLAGQVDFRREMKGGETFAIAWQEDRLPDGSLSGEPRLSYARLELSGRSLELVASSAAGPVLVFEDGEIVQRSAPPILGARLSSVFGKRNHPVKGGVRMHTGIDYAASVGTEVNATGAGRVVFAGTRNGYGLTVDMDHGGGVVTRYAHLSDIAEGVAPGQRLKAGDRIGAVGATGLVSGPNLHYEVRLDGDPVDPLDGEILPDQIAASVADKAALTQWRKATGFASPAERG